MSGGTVDNKKNRRNQSVSPRLFCFCFVCFSVVAQVRIRVLMEVIGSWMRRRLSASIADVTSGTLCNFTSQMTSVLSLSLFLLPAGDGQLFQRVSYTTRNKKISNKISKKRRRRASGNLSLFSSKIYRSSGRRRKKKKTR